MKSAVRIVVLVGLMAAMAGLRPGLAQPANDGGNGAGTGDGTDDSARIVDSDGRPMAGVPVIWFSNSKARHNARHPLDPQPVSNIFRRWQAGEQPELPIVGQSGDDGRIVMTWPATAYDGSDESDILAMLPGHLPAMSRAKWGDEPQGDWVLERAMPVTVRVLKPDGAPAAGAHVRLGTTANRVDARFPLEAAASLENVAIASEIYFRKLRQAAYERGLLESVDDYAWIPPEFLVADAETDADGRAVLPIGCAGRWHQVMATLPGWRAAMSLDIPSATAIATAVGEPLTVRLTAGREIRGRILDQYGRGVANAWVVIAVPQPLRPLAASRHPLAQTAVSDLAGEFIVRGLPTREDLTGAQVVGKVRWSATFDAEAWRNNLIAARLAAMTAANPAFDPTTAEARIRAAGMTAIVKSRLAALATANEFEIRAADVDGRWFVSFTSIWMAEELTTDAAPDATVEAGPGPGPGAGRGFDTPRAAVGAFLAAVEVRDEAA